MVIRRKSTLCQQETKHLLKSRIWYLPHHTVFNSNKEDKLRVVLIYFCERIYFSFERLLPFVVLSVS